ncbi:MAG: InlB B-repeat-containing protein [Paracholeplasma sp.]|nr:InlB B-repeat-containing protein [Paracholeplasma sp.]MDY3196114.1 InlB B-repeat-containing protein [Paracholeplasma sp.]
MIGIDNTSSYSGAVANTRSNIYYDVSVLINYAQPRTLKPAVTVGGYGVLKTSMFAFELEDKFGTTNWTFRDIEGNYAYFPQLKVFATSTVDEIKNDSVISVRTNPFLGDGTKASPYIITTAQDMVNLSNSITPDFNALGVYYLVGSNISNIDLSTVDYKAIGTLTTPFKGHFDGNYANFNLNINVSEDYQGLFGYISSESTVSKLSVSGSVTGRHYVSGVVAKNDGIVSEVYSTALINGQNYTAGVVGQNTGELSRAYNTGQVYSTGARVGGVVGSNSGIVLDVYHSNRIHGLQYVGGVAGYNTGTITNAYFNITVIEFYTPESGIKPAYAVGNQQNTDDVRGVAKEILFTLDNLNFTTTDWATSATTGMYDYLVQLTGFRNNVNSTIKNNSELSARIIRFAAGSGDQNSPYIIRHEADMKVLSDVSKEDSLLGIYFKVLDGVTLLDLTDADLGFTTIGSSTRKFMGFFDGNNAKIVINLNKSTTSYQGLFGYVENGKIENLTVSGDLSGLDYVGGIAGYLLNTTVLNVSSDVIIKGRNYVGGIAGYSNGSNITNAYNMNDVTATGARVAGISGHAQNETLAHVFNYGQISGTSHIGGIVGYGDTKTVVLFAYNRNNIKGTSSYVAGIVGYLNNGSIDNTYSSSSIRGLNNVGGILGASIGTTTVTNSFYDQSLIEADIQTVGVKPVRAVGNVLDQDDVYGIGKSYLTGLTNLPFDQTKWVFVENDGVNAYYPQLKVFTTFSDQTAQDSLESISSYIFAGTGEETSPYIIVNEYDMTILSTLVSEGIDFTGVYFKVRENAISFDMTLTGLDYTPVGNPTTPFNGLFDGSGVNFKLGLSGSNYQGLFGYVGTDSIIKQLSTSGTITGNDYVGSIAGYNKGTIHTVYSTTQINAKSKVGGIVGSNEGLVYETYYISTLNAVDTAGGIVGYNSGQVNNGYVVARLSANSFVGGVVGINDGILDRLYYNSEIAEIYKPTSGYTPIRAIGNTQNTETVLGLTATEMHQPTLINMPFTTLTKWEPKAPLSFEVFYPQLSYFSKHQTAEIKALSLLSVSAMRFKEGTGTEADPYIIRNADDMKAISDLVSGKNTLKDTFFRVADDVTMIDLDVLEAMYVPIGNESYRFEGSFDGNFARFNLNIDRAAYYQGLFGYIGINGVVRNLSVEGSVRSGSRFAGGIVGRNAGLIENVYNLATITAYDYYAGGIAGYNNGVIRNVYNNGLVTVTRYDYAGGITGGQAKGTEIYDAYNSANVKGRNYIGGIAGHSSGSISRTYSVGQVSGNAALGGIIGGIDANAQTEKSYYDLSVMVFVVGNKPVAALGNGTNLETVYGLTTSELSGGYLAKADLGTAFKTKPNDGFTAYHPQLQTFANSAYALVKADSLESVTRSVFQGDGSQDNPYLILSEADMSALSLLVLQNVDTNATYFKVFEKDKSFDLALDSVGYNAIGAVSPFEGHFDGNNATFNVNIEMNGNYQGLFGKVTDTASLSNLTVTGKVVGLDYVGGVAGYNEGMIDNVINQAEIIGMNYTGGIAGYNKSTLNNSYNEGRIAGTTSYAGGITGYNDSNALIDQAFNKGDIHSSAEYVGGISGVNELNATITNSFNYGTLYTGTSKLGGIVGLNNGHIQNVYNTGELEAALGYVAGLAAYNTGTITEGFHSGYIRGESHTAGIVSVNAGTLSFLYYNIEHVSPRIIDPTLELVSSAVYQTVDTTDVKGLLLINMSGLTALGNNDEQMNFEKTKYSVKLGNDFTSYYPELLVFKNHIDLNRQAYSLESVTDKKLDGNGTLLDPYIIEDGFDMNTINEFIMNENHFINKYFKVKDGISVIDLTLTELWYTPLGNDQNSFRGHLDGNNANFILDLDNESSDYLGIFHTLGMGSSVKNLTVSGQVIGRSYLGSVAGRNYGTIENVTNLAAIKSFGSINDGANSIGGITGVNVGTIKNVVNKGIVSAQGSYVGGIVGENELTITDSYNKAPVSGASHVAGIAGLNRSTISKTYNTQAITGITVVGGITGENRGSVTESFNDGNILATKDIAGGVVGLQADANATTNRIYHSASVRTNETIAGGIIGKLDAGQLHDAYNSGDVSGKSSIGMIVGQYLSGAVSRSYYDMNVLQNYAPTTLEKPTKAFGNYDKLDDLTVKGLYHGQMIGLNSIGTSAKQMNFYYPASFKTISSYGEYGFYPQINFFTTHTNGEVQSDSLESVRSITFMQGSGTEFDPYILTDESDIIALAETVNSGNTYAGIYFKVALETTEFNFFDSEENYLFTAIGNEKNPFDGYLDGNAANFKINLDENLSYQALFGHVGKNAVVKNLSVSGKIKGLTYTAGIAGINYGFIHDVYNQAEIIGTNYVGGITGQNDGILENAYNKGSITGNDYVGGISGKVTNITDYTYNVGVVYGKNYVGAIAGVLESDFVFNSFYDTRVLGAYRDASGYVKPTKAASNSEDSDTVYGLDKTYMTGLNAIGNSELQVHLNTTNWTTNYNVDGTANYPQLKVFSRSIHEDVKANSKASTLTTLYTITYDYKGATADNAYPLHYVLPNEHYQLAVPFKFGFEIEGWYLVKENGDRIKYTDENGLSINPFSDETNITLEANWEVAKHAVNFVDGNNQIIETQTVLHGDFAEESALIPTKNPSLTKIYFFDYWDFDFSSMITEETNIKAVYTEIDRYYNVTFNDGNGHFFTQIKVEYGQKATPPEQNPSKLFDEFAYKFTGWDFNFEQIIDAPVVINSIFEAVDRYYDVRFINPDGTILFVDTYEYGSSAIAPATPTMASTISTTYQFVGWDQPFDNITAAIDVEAVYEQAPRYYEVRFIDGDGKAYNIQQVAYNEAATTPTGLPIKSPLGDNAYKFTGWDQTFTAVTSDLVIFAQYEAIDRYYEVNFVDGDNNPFGDTIVVEYMQKATLPNGTPTKTQTVQYEYLFMGWDEAYMMIMGNATITPIFEEQLRPYKVTFLDGNLDVYEIQDVLYGQNANNPMGEPSKTPVGDIAYKFTGWDVALTNVTSERTIKAQFVEVDRYYTVTFYGYDLTVALKSEKVEYRGAATAPTPPIKEDAREAYENVFVGWDKAFDDVRSNLVVKAQYVNRMRTYEITVINGDETNVYSVNHGTNFVLPAPVKTGSDQVVYDFVHWLSNGEIITSLSNVKQNYLVEGVFEASYNYYVVTFVDGDNNIIEVQNVLRGDDAKSPMTQPIKETTDDFVYIFTGWDRAFTDIESDVTIRALFDERDKYNEVIFNDALGNELSRQTVEYGLAALAPETPVKPMTAKFEYHFTGWDQTYDQIYSDLVINPTYEEVIRMFTVQFLDGDLNEVLSVSVEYGKPVVAPTTATKTPSDTIYYLFREWSNNNLTSITEDLVITALFDEVDRYYTVRFLGIENSVEKLLYTQTVEYGKDAFDPIKFLDYEVLDDFYIWAITGWDDTFTEIKASKDIHAVYGQVDRYYTVRFLNEDGSEIETQIVEYGQAAQTPLSAPTKEATYDFRYEFKGYSDDYSFITKSMDLYAEFNEFKNQNVVTFIDGNGDVFDTQNVAYAQSALEPDGIPMKAPTKEFEFIFTGWNRSLDNITEDTAIVAEFQAVTRYYTVIFVNTSNQVLKEEQVQFGHPATAPLSVSIPEDTAEYTYTYGWNKDFSSISDNTKVTLVIFEELNDYTYTFYDAYGEIYAVINAPYGTIILKPAAPVKEKTEQFTFTFIDWDQMVPLTIKEDLTFNPVYEETIRTYTVTFLDGDGNVFDTQEIKYGFSGVLPTGIPTKTGNEQYYYEFRMWYQKPENIKADTVIEAVYNRFLQTYEVTFVDEFGHPIKKQEVAYGTGATEPTFDLIPTKAPTTEYEYVFAGWDKSFNFITKDTVVMVRYVAVLRLYTYTFYDDDHVTILKQVKGRYGSLIVPPPTPVKPSEETVNYRFVGWDKMVAQLLTSNVDYFAVYEAVPITYKVTFFDGNNQALDLQIINHGESAVEPSRIPTKAQTARYEYTFSGWDKAFDVITSDLNVLPLFEEKIRTFNVTFVYDGFEIVIEKQHNTGIDFDIDPIPTPIREGFGFVSWDKDLSVITEDITTEAIYKPNRYQIIYYGIDVDDGGLPTEVVAYGSQVILSESNFTKRGYTFAGWKTDPNTDIITYTNKASFVYDEAGNLALYAAFDPIVYEVIYDTDGGSELPPDPYTIETPLAILPTPIKEDHKFIGWELVEIKETLDETAPKGRQRASTTGDSTSIITSLEPGTIGWVVLKARYVFDGFIEVKDEYKDVYSIVYAEVTSIIPIEVREDEGRPVYLLGVSLNQTLEDLKEKFLNETIEFLDKDGVAITDLQKVVFTGLQVVIRDGSDPSVFKDRVRVVLKGDVSGDGRVNATDYNTLISHLNSLKPLLEEYLLSGLLSSDDRVNATDYNALVAYLSGSGDIYA